MESWEGRNYTTQNTTQWVVLMNLSTVEWGVGYLPDKVVAIPGSFNESSTSGLPADVIVIPNAGQSQFGSRRTQGVILGIVSAIVILWAGSWLWTNRHKMFGPLKPASTTQGDDNSQGNGSVAALTTYGDRFITLKAFEDELRHSYYDGDKSFPEVSEKKSDDDGIDATDVEAAVDLLRKMYSIDLDIWAKQNSPRVTAAMLNEMRIQSDAILAEVNRLVQSWDRNMRNPAARASEKEWMEMAEIIEILRAIGPERYPNKMPVHEPMETMSQR